MLRRVVTLCVVLAALQGHARASSDAWIKVSSEHFSVVTDAGEKQARHILDQFERMRWTFQTFFPKIDVDPSAPIIIFAARNEKVFETVEPAPYISKGQLKLAGYFMKAPDKNYILLRLDAENEQHPYATIYHEYTHLQLSPFADGLPLWLNEGMAEFFQNTDIHNKDVQLGEPSYDDLIYLQQNRLIPLPVLFRVDANSPYYHEEQKGSVFYAESWALTHYLEMHDRESGTHHIADYMTLISKHEDPVIAAETVFGDLKKLQSALEDYTHAARYMHFVLNSAAAPIDESKHKVTPLKPTDADAVRADVLAYVQRFKDSQSLLDEVLKADPDNARAHETEGFLAFREGRIDEARKWYGEAVKLDSQSYLAHYYYASLTMQYPGTGEDKEIEASLRKAIELNPRFGPAYDRLASYFGMRHENLDEAKKLALQAIKLDPGNLSIRLNAANVYATADRADDAATILRSALKLARNPAEEAMVQSRLDQLARFKEVRRQAMTAPVHSVEEGRTIVMNTDTGPKHPTEPSDGPKHEATGVIHTVKCSYPSVIEFSVVSTGKTVSLYSNNYFKLDFTALGFTPEGEMHPCEDLEGKNARVQYAESSDKTVDGQAIAIELHK